MEENNLFYSAKSEVKILVVDDREDNLLSIETILERDGYIIEKALSGRAALKILLNQHDFTLILMDVQMPDMNGFETASLIYQRDKLKHIPIIFITAHNQDEEFMFKGYKMGAVDFIYKPINPELLRFKVSVFAELYRKNHQLLMHERELKAVNKDLQNEIEERRATEEKIKQLNRQLIDNNTELKAINEELDRFAYVASHDLQEPLRKIMLFSDKLLLKMHHTSDPVMSNALERIIRSAERMQKLINDLLKLSRHTQTDDDFENTDLNEVLKDVVIDLEAELQRRQASISIASLPTIWAIPSQVRQLFQNLISNSLKFCRHDCIPQIAISCEKVKGFQLQQFNEEQYEKNYYRITVSDNGIGFDPKYADDIFVVFKRLHSHHEFEGTGIGLSICKKIVEKHNGFISATGELGKGATFVVAFPEKVTEAVA
ncbi:MAG: sensor histidine kinase [Chitinophagaceae bacterium]